MYKLFSLLFFTILSITIVNGQSTWELVDGEPKIKASLEREIIPVAFTTYKLDSDRLIKELRNAPMKDDHLRSINGASVNMPQPDGSIANYTVWEAPVMAPGISARYPDIKSYQGFNTVVPSEVIRFDVSMHGLRAAIRSSEGQIYIDPYALGQQEYYISYFTRDDHGTGLADGALQCGVTSQGEDIDALTKREALRNRSFDGEVVDLRTYRIAVAGTAEWSNRRGSVAACLADVNTACNRLSLIWENEASITFEVIERNDELFFFDAATQPYSDTRQGRVIIGENTSALNNIVGFDAYDIGHVFSRCFDVGGIAARPSVCLPRKGAAVTCANSSNPTAWAIGTFAHEVGHQFNMNHSFNHCDGENESTATGFEPGSGSTIMSYAGGCGSQLNVQNDNDDYYHLGSLIEAYGFTRTGGDADECSVRTVTGNRAPIIELPYESGLFIPISTPFEVTGSATDLDGDAMTYNWEQLDSGPLSPRGAPIANAPLFRSLYPSTNPTRVFPNLNSLLNLIPTANEVLPTTTRDVTLAFVARDNHAGSGTASWEILEFYSTANAGPFTIDYPNSFLELTVGDEMEVTWDVANTDQAPVNADLVDIYLSVDGGFTYPHLLAERVPNDGAQTVVLPNDPTFSARIKVKASDNIFFDVSNRDFELIAPTDPTFSIESGAINVAICLPDLAEIVLPTVAFNDYGEEVTLSVVDGLPMGATATFSPATILPGETSVLTVDLSSVGGTATYDLRIAGTGADGQVVQRSALVSTTGTDFTALAPAGMAQEGTGMPLSPTLEWSDVPDATYYVVDLATNPSFDQDAIVFSRRTGGLTTVPDIVLEPGSVYYWRVSAGNDCAEAMSMVTAFSTESLACSTYTSPTLPRAIGTTTGGVNIPIDVSATGVAADVNIKRIKGDHTRVGDLSATLASPDGTVVALWGNRCVTQQDYDMTLDDDSPNLLACPLRGGQLYQPEGSLSDFNAKEINGTWILRVEDNRSGNGGSVDIVDLEICGNVSLSPPVLTNHELAVVDRGVRTVISNTTLAVDDANHAATQLIYTLVEAPAYGDILVDSEPISAGGQWTQSDIDQRRLVYRHDNGEDVADALRFTVEDPDGGWVSVTTLDIEIVGEVVVSVNDVIDDIDVVIYPNPTSELINVQVNAGDWDGQQTTLRLYDLNGQLMMTRPLIEVDQQLNVGGLASGIYLLEIADDTHRVVEKVSVIR